MVAQRLLRPGPPIPVMLDWISSVTDRAALAAFLSGDLFLACHAGNYYAKGLIPHSMQRRTAMVQQGTNPSRICLFCWTQRDVTVLENEAHVCLECPAYDAQRDSLFSTLSQEVFQFLSTNQNADAKLHRLLASSSKEDIVAFARFLGRLRQVRRKLRKKFEAMQKQYDQTLYSYRKQQWRSQGYWVCRHGLFYKRRPTADCTCMESCWGDALWMPHLSKTLKAIVVTAFDASQVRRIGQVQAELKKKQ
eukprot:4650546-Karenia_brevis.AAC.1